MAALEDFGFGGAGIPRELFERAGSAIHLGVEPNRIDLLTRLEGVEAETVFGAATHVELGGTVCKMISLEHLIVAKKASSRLRDQADVEELLRLLSAADPRD